MEQDGREVDAGGETWMCRRRSTAGRQQITGTNQARPQHRHHGVSEP